MNHMIAAILATSDLQRLYAGLSLLVSAATEGRPARGLASFAALPVLVDPLLGARARRSESTPDLTPVGRETFASSLLALLDTAAELEDCRLWACAAALETTGVARADVEARLDGVLSTPRFLREVAGADLVMV